MPLYANLWHKPSPQQHISHCQAWWWLQHTAVGEAGEGEFGKIQVRIETHWLWYLRTSVPKSLLSYTETGVHLSRAVQPLDLRPPAGLCLCVCVCVFVSVGVAVLWQVLYSQPWFICLSAQQFMFSGLIYTLRQIIVHAL